MKRVATILLLGWSLTLSAMTVEQRQQFVYYYYEAERLWHAEQYADAFALFDFCHTLNPSDPMVNRYLGYFYRGTQRVEQSLPYFRVAWEQAPKECWKDYAIILYNNGDNADRQEAVRVMEQTALLNPTDGELWDKMRDAYIGLQQFPKALQAQDRLDQIDGYNAYSAINRYRIHMLMRQPKPAIRDIEKYLQEDPENIQFQIYRMQLYEATGRKRQLPAIYQKLLQLDPYNPLVLNNYAYMLAGQKKDLLQAEQMSLKAIQAEPNNPIYLDTYAWILYLTDKKELAKLYIRQAMLQLQGQDIPTEIQQHYNAICQ